MDDDQAAVTIQRWWLCEKRKLIFQEMKNLIAQAERLLAVDLVRQLCPAEAELLKDPTVKTIVRLRLGGINFPPRLFYKVYLDSRATSVKFVNGRHLIQPLTKAAEEACDLMGEAKYHAIVRHDACLQARNAVVDDYEVVDAIDAVRLQSLRDELPAAMGGRGNYWRPLHSQDLATTGRLAEFVQHMESSFRSEFVFRTGRTIKEDKLARQRALMAQKALNKTLAVSGRFKSKARSTQVNKMRELYGLDGTAINATHRLEGSVVDMTTLSPPIGLSSASPPIALRLEVSTDELDDQDLLEWADGLDSEAI